jgi:protein-disulfide isomerase
VLAAAAEAAGKQGKFWEMHDSLLEDQGHLDDPHLWERAKRFELDLERFEADRRSAEAADRVERDFHSGIRAGVATTPTQFLGGVAHPGVPGASFTAALRSTP